MSNQWFRMYNEFASDPKVQTLSEAMQRRLIMLFCLESGGSLKDLTSEEIAFALRLDDVTLHETLQVFRQKGFIDENNHIQNWDKRQYKSDSSAERVKKFREKSKVNNNVTETKRYSNANVTPPEQNRTDTEQKDKNINKKETENLEFEYFYNLFANKIDPQAAKKSFLKARQKMSFEEICNPIPDYLAYLKATGIQQKNPATWLNQSCWENDYKQLTEKFNASTSQGKVNGGYHQGNGGAVYASRGKPTVTDTVNAVAEKIRAGEI